MDDVWALLLAVSVDVVHVITLSEECIDLDSDHRIFLAIYVLSLYVELRAVERGLALLFCELKPDLVENVSHKAFVAFPLLSSSEVILSVIWIPLGQTICYVALETESCEAVLSELYAALEFLGKLILSYYQMAFRDRELTNSRKSVHLTCLLISEQG